MRLRKSTYHCHTSVSDAQQRPHLYKIKQLLLAEMKINIVMLLKNSADDMSDIPPIPSEDEVLKILSLDQQVAAQNAFNTSERAGFKPKNNELFTVIWDQSDGQKWYLAMGRQCVYAIHFWNIWS